MRKTSHLFQMHVKDRDLVKEMLQQALIHHRQIVSQVIMLCKIPKAIDFIGNS